MTASVRIVGLLLGVLLDVPGRQHQPLGPAPVRWPQMLGGQASVARLDTSCLAT
jgi:hypothetical protein